MIEFDLDTANSILLVRPQSALEEKDFVELAGAVDPQIEAHGDLAGLIINAPKFPGWDSFGTMVEHFRFVKDHHKHIAKVALVTDSPSVTLPSDSARISSRQRCGISPASGSTRPDSGSSPGTRALDR